MELLYKFFLKIYILNNFKVLKYLFYPQTLYLSVPSNIMLFRFKTLSTAPRVQEFKLSYFFYYSRPSDFLKILCTSQFSFLLLSLPTLTVFVFNKKKGLSSKTKTISLCLMKTC